MRPGDERRLREFFGGLDARSQAFRFFSAATDLDRAAHEMARVDYRERYGLLARRGGEEGLVGHGVYLGLGPGTAEVAFAVAAPMQGHGLGTILLAHLAEAAAENGIDSFFAEVLPANRQMVEMFRQSGFPLSVRIDPDAIRVELSTSLSPQVAARFAERDRVAAVEAVRAVLEPRSVAVVGASRDPGRVGGAVLGNVLSSGFGGALHAVNPAAESVQDLPSARALGELGTEIDLVVSAVPAAATEAVAREAAAVGARALVVLSAGFGESGPAGAEREGALLRACREAGARLVGPNCLGVLSTDPAAPLNATFAPGSPPAGNVGFVTQSGALGLSLIELAAEMGIGVSSFVSVGNRADITANDLLEYWEQDPRTRVALLYIESFSDPRRFARISRRVGREMPVVVVKGGRSGAGARAAGSHTGALLAASDRASDALFEQTGVIRAGTLSELLDVAALLATQPLPRGPRVGILTNAGGPGIMCADACEGYGLEVPELGTEVREELRTFLPPQAALGNPVDMIATAGPEDFRRAIRALAGWEGIDALIVIFIRPLLASAGEVAAAIVEASGELPRELPVQAVLMSPADRGAAEAGTVPAYAYPEEAARALGKVMSHVRWRARTSTPAPPPADLRRAEAARILAEAVEEGREWLDPPRRAALLDAYGIAIPASRTVADAAAAGAAAAEIGGPVALKAAGPGIQHKTEIGAVRLGLSGAREVAAAAAEIDRGLAARGLEREAFEVQAMVEGGVELILGIVADPVFGPVVACGAGGTAVELFGDVQLRVSPLDREDPGEMLDRLAVRPLLDGYRGAPAADVPALEEAIARLGFMAEAHPEIAELDLNPVLATPTGAIAVDCRVRVRPRQPPRSWPKTWE